MHVKHAGRPWSTHVADHALLAVPSQAVDFGQPWQELFFPEKSREQLPTCSHSQTGSVKALLWNILFRLLFGLGGLQLNIPPPPHTRTHHSFKMPCCQLSRAQQHYITVKSLKRREHRNKTTAKQSTAQNSCAAPWAVGSPYTCDSTCLQWSVQARGGGLGW